MPLYGNELDRQLTPYEAGLGRVVKLDKSSDFVGRAALEGRASQPREHVLVGLAGLTRRVPRHGFPVLWDGAQAGTVTSGGHSPTLGRPIAMAYLSAEAAEAAQAAREGQSGANGRLAIEIRGSAEPAELIPLPFYRRQPRD